MRRRLVTINEVAAVAGASASTAPRVLNGRAGNVGISARLCERVHAAADRLHYALNHAAQSLARQRTGVIVLRLWRHSDSPCGDIAAGIATVANRRGYQLSAIDAGALDEPVEEQALRYLCSGTCDGVILAQGSGSSHAHDIDPLTALIDPGMTVVLALDHHRVSTVPWVDVDNAIGAYIATKHLLISGHWRIVHFIVDRVSPTRAGPHPPKARYHGYLTALQVTGFDSDSPWVLRGSPTREGGRALVHALVAQSSTLTQRPTAVVAFNRGGRGGVVSAAGLPPQDDRRWRGTS